MNMLLFYFSALDGWNDDRNTMKYTLSKMYQKRAKAVSEKYPEKARVIREELEKLSEIEKASAELAEGNLALDITYTSEDENNYKD